jgi:hypothetical protein
VKMCFETMRGTKPVDQRSAGGNNNIRNNREALRLALARCPGLCWASPRC